MFDTMKVAQKIREARNARNMTQTALADEMGVSYQAVSNWERGNSMPDISKLEQLCNVLGITIYELLGTEEKQAETVSKILGDGALPAIEDLAEIAPMLPPVKIKAAVSETARKRQINWDSIVSVAPFLDQEMLDEILENTEAEDFQSIVALAPFLSRRTLDRLVLGCDKTVDKTLVISLAPFLCSETLEKLVLRYDREVDRDLVTGLAPFLSRDTLEKLVIRYDGEVDMEMVDHLAPFLSRETLSKLVEMQMEKGNVSSLSHLYPFLSRETMRALVRKMMEEGDFDAMRNAVPFV